MTTFFVQHRDSHHRRQALATDNMDKMFRKFSLKPSKSTKSDSNTTRSISSTQSPIAMARNQRDASNHFSTTVPTRRPAAAEPPPPYSPANANASSTQANSAPFASAGTQSTMQTGDDSPYAFLRTFDTIFLIDDSGSMAGRSWRETSAALEAIAPICTAHDPDGIDVYFLNHRNPHSTDGGYRNLTTTAAVQNLFKTVRPLGGTPTGTRLNQILKPYVTELADSLERQAHGREPTVKPLNIIVITDGVPSDDVESVIVSAARKLDGMSAESWQVGIQFFQVGREPEAAEMLRELDDALSSEFHIRDMVDTVPWNGEDNDGSGLTGQGLLKVCLGSVVRRWDRRTV